MTTIFVLEDDFVQQSRMERTIKEVMKKNSWKYRRIHIYGKPNQLLESITERGSHQLFFLDIQIKNESKRGFEIAEEIRRKDPNATIVFVTTHSEFMPIIFQYKVAALDFIDKGLDERAFSRHVEEAINTVIEQQGRTVIEDSFNFETSLAMVQVPFHNILYFETSPTIHKVILHTKNERMEFYARISEIEKVDKRLYKCHQSYVVNLENIIKVDKENGKVYFEDNEYCLVSRMRLKGLIDRIKKLQ